ncbi:MAG TPA: neutral zinc metallopeptidase [Gemmatimonadales bacterium]|jgi:hypothetical protein
MSDQYFTDMARRAVTPTACPASTPVVDWYLDKVFDVINNEPDIFFQLYDNWADLVPTYEALIFQTAAMPQYFGYNGEYNQRMTKTERDVKRFWDINSADIQVVAMHGPVLLNEARVVPTYKSDIFLGLDNATAVLWASQDRAGLLASQRFNGGNHPFFSFNAFALSAPELGLPDKIVMGDGILEGYKAVGYDDVALPAVFAHEFGHHIQYERGYIDEPVPGAPAANAAEQTRYTELMADAFSAYYLTHKRGGTMNKKRVEQFLQVFFQIGDCSFESSGHHGTPAQRMRAAQYGFKIADEAQKQGHILTAAQFHAGFVTVYPSLVAP